MIQLIPMFNLRRMFVLLLFWGCFGPISSAEDAVREDAVRQEKKVPFFEREPESEQTARYIKGLIDRRFDELAWQEGMTYLLAGAGQEDRSSLVPVAVVLLDALALEKAAGGAMVPQLTQRIEQVQACLTGGQVAISSDHPPVAITAGRINSPSQQAAYQQALERLHRDPLQGAGKENGDWKQLEQEAQKKWTEKRYRQSVHFYDEAGKRAAGMPGESFRLSATAAAILEKYLTTDYPNEIRSDFGPERFLWTNIVNIEKNIVAFSPMTRAWRIFDFEPSGFFSPMVRAIWRWMNWNG